MSVFEFRECLFSYFDKEETLSFLKEFDVNNFQIELGCVRFF